MNLVPLRCVPSESVSASNMYIHSPGHNLGDILFWRDEVGDIYLFTYLFICLFINLFFFRFLGIHLYIHIAGVLDFYFMSYTLLSLIVSMFPLRTSTVLLSAFRSK